MSISDNGHSQLYQEYFLKHSWVENIIKYMLILQGLCTHFTSHVDK